MSADRDYVEVAQLADESYRRDLEDRVILADAAESFLRSPLGRYLEKRAQDNAMDAMQALKSVDPNNAVAVRALQNEVFRAESIALWIAQAIQDGQLALDEIRQQET